MSGEGGESKEDGTRVGLIDELVRSEGARNREEAKAAEMRKGGQEATVRACMRARVRVCVRACEGVSASMCECVLACLWTRARNCE
eukprot:5004245-Pleurochrysis_carterae.AAC.2